MVEGQTPGREDWNWGAFGDQCGNLVQENSLESLRVSLAKTSSNQEYGA